MVLIGSGWLLLKYNLSTKEKRLMIAVVSLQITGKIFEVLHNETAYGSGIWRASVRIVQI
jgi:hypothetical protein